MFKELLEIAKILWKIGLPKVLKTISAIAWFILPFMLWDLIRRSVGDVCFQVTWSIPGIFLQLCSAALAGSQAYFFRVYEFRLMKRVEHARDMFNNPEDPENEIKFRRECESFIPPYVHHEPMLMAGGRVLLANYPKIQNISMVATLYMSYSLFALVIYFQNYIRQAILFIQSLHQVLPNLFELILQNWFPFIVATLLLSLYYEPIIRYRYLWTPHVRGPLIALYVRSIFNLESRVGLLSAKLFAILVLFKEFKYVAKYEPFIDPQTLPAIIQLSVHNVEKKSCDVTRWDEKAVDEEHAKEHKDIFLKDRRVPWLAKFLVRVALPRDIMKNIRDSDPLVYLGTVENRCVFLGLIQYDIKDKIRTAKFYFGTTYIREEFILIMKGEVEKQRKIESMLAPSLREIADKIGRF